jgi:hypothetical protein
MLSLIVDDVGRNFRHYSTLYTARKANFTLDLTHDSGRNSSKLRKGKDPDRNAKARL